MKRVRNKRSAKKTNKTVDKNKYQRQKYREKHEEVYYTVVNVPVNKDLWNFVNEWIENARIYKEKLVYGNDVMSDLKRNKQVGRRELTEKEKNGLRAVVAYIYTEMKKRGRFDYTNIYNVNIRACGNNLKIGLINEFLKSITNQKMSTNKQLNGKVLIDVEMIDYYSKSLAKKIKDDNLKNKTALVKVRSFKLTKAVCDEQINVVLKLTPGALLSWDLFTPEQMEELCNHLDDKPIKCYYNNYYLKSNAYKDCEDKYKGFHLQLTTNEQMVADRYKNISVDYRTLTKIIDETSFKKSNVDFESIKDISYALLTLAQRNITFKHGRLYYPRFTTLSTDYVDKVLFLNGKHLIELFDVKSCFVVMSMLLYADSLFVDDQELKKLYRKVIDEDFYVWIGNEMKIKQQDDESFKEWRERCKQAVISWLFKTSSAKVKTNVDKIIKKEFPTYYNWLHSLENVYDNKEKKNKCVLSVKCSWLENKLILNGLFDLVKTLDSVTKHDAIYVAEDQYSVQLKQYIQKEWLKIINNLMKGTKNNDKETKNEKASWN